MPFVSVPGLKGKVYAPDKSRDGFKKNPCRDCFACQRCSDDRCRVCLSAQKCEYHNALKSKKDEAALSKGMSPCGCGMVQ